MAKKEINIVMEEEENFEFVARDQLREKREKITSFDDLTAFLKDVEENYNCGYGTAPRAVAQGALAVAWYLCGRFGLTGFQAGFVMWDFIRDWNRRDNKCGMKLVDYDDMLYPVYEYKFEKVISEDTWKALQEEAANRLANHEDNDFYVHPDVIKHWQSIVDGKVPFGYSVKND